MSYTIKLLPEARLDIIESIDWYNEQKEGLGKLFYHSVKSRMNYIKRILSTIKLAIEMFETHKCISFHIRCIIK